MLCVVVAFPMPSSSGSHSSLCVLVWAPLPPQFFMQASVRNHRSGNWMWLPHSGQGNIHFMHKWEILHRCQIKLLLASASPVMHLLLRADWEDFSAMWHCQEWSLHESDYSTICQLCFHLQHGAEEWHLMWVSLTRRWGLTHALLSLIWPKVTGSCASILFLLCVPLL